MFEGWSHWTWVSIAWAEVLIAYGGYLAYLGWRRRQLLREQNELTARARPVSGPGGPGGRA